MKYLKELLGIICILLLTILIGIIPFVSKLSNIFIPSINRYLYIFSFLSFIYMMTRYILNNNKTNKIGLIIVYSIVVLLTLFVRKKYDTYQYSFDFYLFEWFKKMFTDKVIFINLIGNLILFAPLGFILSTINNKGIKTKVLNIVIGIGIIICLELGQFITKRGVLDLMDILLNSIGLVMGILIIKKGGIKNA